MKNVIAERITDFLKEHQPFIDLKYKDLLSISQEVVVKYLEKNEILFKIDEQTHPVFYVVQSGAVGLYANADENEVLVDQCDEGDIFGLRPFFASNKYLMNAKAKEESILYAIPIEVFKPFALSQPKILDFLLQSFASNTRNPLDEKKKGRLLSENYIYEKSDIETSAFKPIKYTTQPITAKATHVIKQIALKMKENKIGSVIIEKNNLPVGIITDKDIRNKIGTGEFSIDEQAKTIMSAPVYTVKNNISIAEAQLKMLHHNIAHLCVTEDGTDNSAIIGIISEHDVINAQANNPGVLIKSIRRCKNSAELKDIRDKISQLIVSSIEQSIPLFHVNKIVGKLNDAIQQQVIELSIAKMEEPPPVDFAWFNVGSQGRHEQLLLTDQDNAIVFADVKPEKYSETKKYFLSLAEKVTKSLNKIGYDYCPANMMASNEEWCKSYAEWLYQYHNWITSPAEKGILMCQIFFDLQYVYGHVELIDDLATEIHRKTRNNQLFYAYLGSEALKTPPPLGFFRQFIVEKDGEHKDQFDIKARALLPLIDMARLLVLEKDIRNITNTYLRFKKLADIEPQNAEIYEACADAFQTFNLFRTNEGLNNNNNGRFINIENLSKSDKVRLKNAFHYIQELQDIIKNRFHLTYFT
jgi:CBS domain-containing protein